MPPEKLLQRLSVYVEGRVKADVTGDGLDNRLGDVYRLIPMSLEPFLQLRYLTCALDLNVEFDVLGQAWEAKVARPNEGL